MSDESRMGTKRHELFDDVMAQVEQVLVAHDIKPFHAALAAAAVADRLADHWGGQNFTFPKDYRRKLTKRELQIFDEWRGDNWGELARKYDIAERTVRRVIARIKAKLKAARDDAQMDMLENGPPPGRVSSDGPEAA